jgi:uncharacterized surface protein with fasciclin (FAS1) repeats
MKTRNLLTLCLAGALAAACGETGGNNAAAAGNAAAGEAAEPARTSVGDALGASADHGSFLQALQSAGLIETLRGAGPYTVFAPTDAAFAALPEEARQRLAAPEQRDQLITLLSYHIVPGTVTAADLRSAIDRGEGGRAELATVTGSNLTLSRDGETILVADAGGAVARIARPDQLHANGVIHSIDTVLMPGE